MIITLVVIILCIANYVRLVQKQKSETYDIALVECGALQKPSYNIQKEFYRFLTAGFVHFSIAHLLINMYCLWSMGSSMEMMLGPVRYCILLFGSIITGNIFAYLMGDEYSISGGMSSGIYGLLAVEATLIFATYGIEGITGNPSLLTALLLNLGMNFMPGVGWKSHLGGACFGVLFVSYLFYF